MFDLYFVEYVLTFTHRVIYMYIILPTQNRFLFRFSSFFCLISEFGLFNKISV
ncbi:hypothetical protein C21_04711 [Arenibacter sp. NBRC 103722]|nr:hypothetical protein C21_04711 [Arenibacter sp. NBRC 103722]